MSWLALISSSTCCSIHSTRRQLRQYARLVKFVQLSRASSLLATRASSFLTTNNNFFFELSSDEVSCGHIFFGRPRKSSLRINFFTTITLPPVGAISNNDNWCNDDFDDKPHVRSWPYNNAVPCGDDPYYFLQSRSVKEKEEWLKSKLMESSRNNTVVYTSAFLVVLRALEKDTTSRDAHLRAEKWIRKLEEQYDKHLFESNSSIKNGEAAIATYSGTSLKNIIPTAECYTCVIRAWANAASYEDPALTVTRTERWLRKHFDNPIVAMRPTTETFNAFLDICTKGSAFKRGSTSNVSNKSKGGKNMMWSHALLAQNTLLYMIEESQKMMGSNKYSSSTIPGVISNPNMAPNTESFNLVIRGWTRCRRSMDIVDRAMEVLNLLESYQKQSKLVRPDSKSYAMIMDAISVRAKLKVKQLVNVASAIKKRKKFEMKEKNDDVYDQIHEQRQERINDPNQNGLCEIRLLEDLLEFMRNSCKQTRNNPDASAIQPSTMAYNLLLSCWANLAPLHENAQFEAEKVLQYMQSLHRGKTNNKQEAEAPDSISYLNVIRAWVNSKHPNRGQRATWWLSKQWMDYEFHADEKIQPTVLTYNTVIGVWAQLGQPREAEKLLSELLHYSDAARIDHSNANNYLYDCNHRLLQPNSESFALLIRAWIAPAERGSEQALRTAIRWLDTLSEREKDETSGLVSSVELYTAVLGAARKCVYSSSSPDAILDLAVETFDKLRYSRHKVECLHYSRLLQVGLLALSRHDQSEVRRAFVRQIVQDCRQDGLVSSALLQALANGPIFYDGWTIEESAQFVDDLFPDWPLPSAWTRNIPQKGFLPKQDDLKRTLSRISHHGIDPYRNK